MGSGQKAIIYRMKQIYISICRRTASRQELPGHRFDSRSDGIPENRAGEVEYCTA